MSKKQNISFKRKASIRTRLRYERDAELSDWLFKAIKLMLRTLIEKVNHIQEHMDIIRRDGKFTE